MNKKVNPRFFPFLIITNNIFLISKRISILLLYIGFTTIYAYSSNAQKIDIDLEDVPITTFFKEIQQKSDLVIIYSDELIAGTEKVTVKATQATLEKILSDVLAPLNLGYGIINKQIIINKIEPSIDRTGAKTITPPLQQTVSGTVTDSEGVPLPGANIVEKGTTNGVVADFDGNFSIDVSDENAILIISYIGYNRQEVTIGERTTIAVQLSEDTSILDEVVLTAFGIEKSKKSVSYATQTVDSEQLTQVGNPDIVNSLQGKVAGVIVRSGGGMPGGESQITIRGNNSLTGNNQPLYVIDGIPIADNPNDLNPDIIESMEVLKGATAAALYGLRASNGVILITTKSGYKGIQEPVITFSSNFRVEEVSRLPDYQQTYSQGSVNGAGESIFQPGNSPFSWGPRISGIGTYTNQFGEQEVAQYYDNAQDFFIAGGTSNSNLSISNGNEKGSYLVSIGYTNQDGIVQNSGLERFNVLINGNYSINDKWKLISSVKYSDTKIAQPVVGNANSNPYYAAFNTPTTYNLRDKPIAADDDPFNQVNFRTNHDNAYWSIKNNVNDSETARLIGNLGFEYSPTDWLSFNYRLGLDAFITKNLDVFQLGSGDTRGRTNPPSGGRIIEQTIDQQQINSNFNIRLQKEDIFKNISASFLLGNEIYDIRNRNLTGRGDGFALGGFNNLSNAANILVRERKNNSRVVGYFGSADISWKDQLFLNFTGRQDIVSNLPEANRSFFYPSVGASAVFSDLFNIPDNILNFGKLRASYAEVGQAPEQTFVQNNFFVTGIAENINFPFNGVNAFRQSPSFIASDLRPVNTKTWEVGAELNFWQNRIKIDYTYFESRATDQIFQVPIANSSGFLTELRNAGVLSTKGHELNLRLTPIRTDNFRWDFQANFTTYENTVQELAEGIDRIILGAFNVEIVAEKGFDYPSIRGDVFARDPASNQIVVDSRENVNGNPNPRYGMPLRGTEFDIIGSVQPDYELGLINTFRYKDFSLTAQVDIREGGLVYSGNNRLGKLYGTLPETANREIDYVEPGMKGFYNDAGELEIVGTNDIVIQQGWEYFRRNNDGIDESNTYDASFVRLREVVLSYDLPSELLKRTPFDAISLNIFGRNLWLSTDFPNYDPEVQSQDQANNAQGIEYTTFPQIKSIGAGVTVKF